MNVEWFMALNELTDERYRDHLQKYEEFVRVAVFSAKLNAPRLKPNLVYNGRPNAFTREIEALGVNVIYHTLSFEHLLDSVPGRDDLWKQVARGAMLRMDIPSIVQSDETVLYTDTDVLFLADPGQFAFPCEIFAAGPEFDIKNFADINTGAMIINLKAARASFAELIEWTVRNLHVIPDYDQGAFRLFYQGKWARLDPRMNWKPYWGNNPQAMIVHYHGPKPNDFDPESFSTKFSAGIYQQLHDLNPNGYAHYIRLWYSYFREYKKLSGNISLPNLNDLREV